MGNPERTRRTFSKPQKQRILREHFDNGLSISVLSRKHQISPVTLYSWKRMLMTDKKAKKEELLPEEIFEELERLRKENDNLKKALAEEVVQKNILYQAVEDGIKKNIARAKSKRLKK